MNRAPPRQLDLRDAFRRGNLPIVVSGCLDRDFVQLGRDNP